jgi:hypothetical protein
MPRENFNDLQVFLVVARTRSFTKAAASCSRSRNRCALARASASDNPGNLPRVMTPVRHLNLYLNRNSRTIPRVLVFRTRNMRPATAGSVSVPTPRFSTAALVSRLTRGRDMMGQNAVLGTPWVHSAEDTRCDSGGYRDDPRRPETRALG